MDPLDMLSSLSSQLNLTIDSLSKLDSIIRTRHATTLSLESPNTCKSLIFQPVDAPEAIVWSFLRDFSKPQEYKHFIKSCEVITGDGATVGSIRDVVVISGLPASRSKERLEVLDEANKVFSFRIIGGDHRLEDYRSVTSVDTLTCRDGSTLTMVVESYVVQVPEGNTAEDTRLFSDTIVGLNLQNLADVSVSAAATAAASTSAVAAESTASI